MSWLLLIGAGILEMLCVTMMNQFQKDRHVKWILFIAAGFSLSFLMLSCDEYNSDGNGICHLDWH